ncbi:MAG TPA: DUF481 domain-containing protein [Gammaproteobacteria bacterium]|nr:DUF481 domain-containing protein [Gammaproteobacteria bacterium]
MKQGILLLSAILVPMSATLAASDVEQRYTRSADAMAAAKSSGWSGSVGLGAVVTSGNTETTNLSGDAVAKLDQENWRHKFEAAALLTEDKGTKTAERYMAGYKVDYKLDARSYLFTALRAEFDKFSGFDEQLSATAGYGYRVLDSQSDTLDLEIGAGVRQNKFNNGNTESESVGRAALDYIHRFSGGNAEFRQGILVLAGENNTSVDSVSAIRANLISSIAMEAALKIKHNSDPMEDRENTDSITSLSLVYGF